MKKIVIVMGLFCFALIGFCNALPNAGQINAGKVKAKTMTPQVGTTTYKVKVVYHDAIQVWKNIGILDSNQIVRGIAKTDTSGIATFSNISSIYTITYISDADNLSIGHKYTGAYWGIGEINGAGIYVVDLSQMVIQ